MKNLDTTLYFITDSTSVPAERFLPTIEAACKGGATLIQLREKNRSTREYMELAAATHEVTKRYNIPLIIDDRVDVALAIGAEGVHVGQTDMPVKIARQLMGADKIIGATTKTVPQALEAYEQGADYLGVGAIYPTTTKVVTILTSVDTLKAMQLLGFDYRAGIGEPLTIACAKAIERNFGMSGNPSKGTKGNSNMSRGR